MRLRIFIERRTDYGLAYDVNVPDALSPEDAYLRAIQSIKKDDEEIPEHWELSGDYGENPSYYVPNGNYEEVDEQGNVIAVHTSPWP